MLDADNAIPEGCLDAILIHASQKGKEVVQ